ncbi:hypothetical protein WR25_03257 [Diploscapter pachys]|uniref:MPN domain-containing protein n=1 Tax=Diploscapter pachys TaxID=2018661 RepID=A0A2A2JQL3_9BILA|nr:hypothetical protein WR25_03257 [Diploscapter pachys]
MISDTLDAEAKSNATERMKKLLKSAESLKVSDQVPIARYYRSLIEMHRMAMAYIDDGNLEKGLVLLVRFCWFAMDEIRSHVDYSIHESEEKRRVAELIPSAMTKAENIKRELKKTFEAEASHFRRLLEVHRRKQQEEQEAELGQTMEKAAREILAEEAAKAAKTDRMLDKKLDHIEIVDPNMATANLNFPSLSSISAASTATKPSAPSINRVDKPTSTPGPMSQKRMAVSGELIEKFLDHAKENTMNNVETCGILCGKMVRDRFMVTHVIIPRQKGSADGCIAEGEEEVFRLQDNEGLITLGWIHTHPSQTAFLSSVDLHTHCAYQTMMGEAIAIVAAPAKQEVGTFVLTPEGLSTIGACELTGFHPHPEAQRLFTAAQHVVYSANIPCTVIDFRDR